MPHRNPLTRPASFWATAACAVAAATLSAAACAQPAGDGARPPAPPPEALAACKAATAGKACSFTTPQGAQSGSCWAPEGKPLACRPANAPPDAPGGKDKPAKP